MLAVGGPVPRDISRNGLERIRNRLNVGGAAAEDGLAAAGLVGDAVVRGGNRSATRGCGSSVGRRPRAGREVRPLPVVQDTDQGTAVQNRALPRLYLI